MPVRVCLVSPGSHRGPQARRRKQGNGRLNAMPAPRADATKEKTVHEKEHVRGFAGDLL